MERARLADGTRPGIPLVSPLVVQEVVREFERQDPGRRVSLRGKTRSIWALLLVSLLREGCSLTLSATANRIGLPISTVNDVMRAHRELLGLDPDYADLAGTALSLALDRLHGQAILRPGGPAPTFRT